MYQAVQVHGRYGYFKGYPVEQFIRDTKIASIWELTTGIHSLIFVAQTIPQQDGQNFSKRLVRMGLTLEINGTVDGVRDLAGNVQEKVKLLGEMGMFFGQCAQKVNLMVPISIATPFLHLVGNVCMRRNTHSMRERYWGRAILSRPFFPRLFWVHWFQINEYRT